MGKNHKRRKAKQQGLKPVQTPKNSNKKLYQAVAGLGTVGSLSPLVTFREIKQDEPKPIDGLVVEPVVEPVAIMKPYEQSLEQRESVEITKEVVEVVEEHFTSLDAIDEHETHLSLSKEHSVAPKGWVASWVNWLWYGNK